MPLARRALAVTAEARTTTAERMRGPSPATTREVIRDEATARVVKIPVAEIEIGAAALVPG